MINTFRHIVSRYEEIEAKTTLFKLDVFVISLCCYIDSTFTIILPGYLGMFLYYVCIGFNKIILKLIIIISDKQ